MKRKAAALASLSADDFFGGALPLPHIADSEALVGEAASDADTSDGSGSDDDDSPATGSGEEEADGQVAALNGTAEAESNSDAGESSGDDEALGVERHARELEALAETDPDFYKYLQAEEPGLLNFAAEDSESDGELAVPADGDGEGTATHGKGAGVELTMPVLRNLLDDAFKRKTLKGLKRALLAFRCGCHLGDDEDTKGGAVADKSPKYRITTSEVYNTLMMTCLASAAPVFLHHLYPKGAPAKAKKAAVAAVKKSAATAGAAGKSGEMEAAAVAETDPRLDPEALKKALKSAPPALGPAILGFFRSLLHVLGQLTDRELLSLVLGRLEKLVPLMVLFPRLGRGYLRALLTHWGAASTTGEEASVQLLAFLRLRELAASQPFPFLEECLKGSYLAFARNAKFTTEQTRPAVTFMTNCVVELFGLDAATSYQLAFVYVRQLALHLRQALHKGTKEACQALCKWQVLNCLRLWTAVVAAYPGPEQLRLLVFPLAQVIAGVARLVPSPRYFPMRFQCVRLLQQLAAASGAYIPTSALLLPVLESPAFAKRPKPSTDTPPAVPLLLKLGKDAVLSRPAQESLVAEALRLLRAEQELLRFSPGYPEMALPLVARLRRFTKSTTVPRWRAQARGLLDTAQRYSAAAVAARAGMRPSGIESLEALRPEGVPLMSARLAAVEADLEEAMSGMIAAAVASRPQKTGQRRSGDAAEEPESDADDSEDDGLAKENPRKRAKKKKAAALAAAAARKTAREAAGGGAAAAAGADDGDVVGELEAWSDEES